MSIVGVKGYDKTSLGSSLLTPGRIQYIWVQEWRALLNTLPMVIVTFAIDCWGKTRPIHLSGFVLKLDIVEVRATRSYSCQTIM